MKLEFIKPGKRDVIAKPTLRVNARGILSINHAALKLFQEKNCNYFAVGVEQETSKKKRLYLVGYKEPAEGTIKLGLNNQRGILHVRSIFLQLGIPFGDYRIEYEVVEEKKYKGKPLFVLEEKKREKRKG